VTGVSVNDTVVTVLGWVGGDINYREVSGGFGVANFRVGTTPRHFDKGVGGWVDRPTTWFQVECWKALADHVRQSVQRGHPVVVTGRLKTSEWVDGEGITRTKTVIDAFSVGHDLTRGTTAFTKAARRPYSAEISSLDEDPTESSEGAGPDFFTPESTEAYESEAKAA
jgi:single-strand DNA-binding protein